MNESLRKYIAEFFGTFVLTFFGCGVAVVCGGFTGGLGGGYLGVVAIALAFGLTIIAGAYAIGDISGCHVNPAVSFGMFLSGRLSKKDLAGYVIFQILGAILACAIMFCIESSTDLFADNMGFGANGYGALSGVGLNLVGALIVEIVLTFVFVMVILRVTANNKTSHMAGIVIGLTLTMVHLIGIPLTGTSVNPARSIGPALFTGGEALSQVWVFIVAPLIGAAIAAGLYKLLYSDKKEKECENESTEKTIEEPANAESSSD